MNRTQTSGESLAIRIPEGHPDHHLWNNHGTWWCHYTVHLPDFTKRRVRRNLHTSDVVTARAIRDRHFRGLGNQPTDFASPDLPLPALEKPLPPRAGTGPRRHSGTPNLQRKGS